MTRYGNVPKCPACDKSVYPVEQVQISIIYNIYTSITFKSIIRQVFAADRKAFHRSCIQCQVRGCR